MSTINQWNTNFTYGEYLTSANMNSSSVGYLYPGIYNADIYLRRSDSGSLSIVLNKGTTIVFSHVKDSDGNMDFEESFGFCTKCIVTEDTDYVIYNPDTDINNSKLKDILQSDMFFIYLMKKVVSTNDSSDYIPILGLLSFSDTGRRIEYTVPSIDISTQFDNEATKAFYQILGVVINTGIRDIFTGAGALSDRWISNHIFTTRCLPSYSVRHSLYDNTVHNDIFFLKHGTSGTDVRIDWNLSHKDLYINGNIYSQEADWKNIYKWIDKEGETALDTVEGIFYDSNNIIRSPNTNNEVIVDFLYATTDCEQSGPDNLFDLFSDNHAILSLNCLSFSISDEDIRTISLKRNDSVVSNNINYTVLYTDNSKSNIERLLGIIKGKNILPKLFNYIRYNRGTSNSDTIIPVAISFRPYTVDNETEIYAKGYLDPNNTLSFFDLQDGNYNLNYCKNSFQMADILSALDDNPETIG